MYVWILFIYSLSNQTKKKTYIKTLSWTTKKTSDILEDGSSRVNNSKL